MKNKLIVMDYVQNYEDIFQQKKKSTNIDSEYYCLSLTSLQYTLTKYNK